jgi:hypothetical protein
MNSVVDVIVLTRDASDLRPAVQAGIDAQIGVAVRQHRVIGRPLPGDRHRWITIARARNQARSVGAAAWVMFLDDDVALHADCIRQLLRGLQSRPRFAALAADFMVQSRGFGRDRHVALGATLFRRAALEQVEFRCTDEACECLCCCDDLRSLGWEIEYWPSARGDHLPKPSVPVSSDPAAAGNGSTAQRAKPVRPARLLAAFNRRHYRKFRRQFLPSLRGSGNNEWVTVLGYGLYPSERRVLGQLHHVEVVSLSVNGVMPPVRRLRDFRPILAEWPEDTPVAYWDAGDVVFQSNLTPLWQIVASHPDRLLAVAEPKGHPDNIAVYGWTRTIHDPQARQRAFQLLSTNPFLNSGFAAGTAGTMLRYFSEADRLLHSKELRGTADWGDQTALNLYCHSDPNRWLQIEEGWNYCAHDRPRGEIHVRPDGRIVTASGTPVYVAHGNAKSLRKLEIAAPSR